MATTNPKRFTFGQEFNHWWDTSLPKDWMRESRHRDYWKGKRHNVRVNKKKPRARLTEDDKLGLLIFGATILEEYCKDRLRSNRSFVMRQRRCLEVMKEKRDEENVRWHGRQPMYTKEEREMVTWMESKEGKAWLEELLGIEDLLRIDD